MLSLDSSETPFLYRRSEVPKAKVCRIFFFFSFENVWILYNMKSFVVNDLQFSYYVTIRVVLSLPPSRFVSRNWNMWEVENFKDTSVNIHSRLAGVNSKYVPFICKYNPYPTAFPYGNGMVLHFYQQQESSTTKTVHKVINKGLKTYV